MASPRISSSAWRERVTQWRASGTALQAYADEHGFSAARLTYWVKQVEREGQSTRLVPVRIPQPVAALGLELRSPTGWTVRIDPRVEPVWLAALLSGLW